MKIVSFELENVKRVALVRVAPGENGLTVIGGKNAQGKTSVLDGIIYALGGEKYRPTNLQRTDGVANARIRIERTGGLIVERRGKNASLHVTDATGRKQGQALLDQFIEELALNLPKFLAMKDDEKAEVLLRTLGIADKLDALAIREKQAFDKRHDLGVIVDQKKKFAAELKEFPNVPDVPVSAAELIQESQAILVRNGERQRRRDEKTRLANKLAAATEQCQQIQLKLQEAQTVKQQLEKQIAECSAPVDQDESTAELEAKIADIDNINAKIRANLDKAKAVADAEEYERRLQPLTDDLEEIRKERRDLLDGASMPLPELTIGKNKKDRPILLYKGQAWDGMSTAEQFRVATAIVKSLKPECGFVLLDGLEAFDQDQLQEFDDWLQAQDLQAICTRVGTDDCTIVIEDGYAVQEGVEAAPEVPDMNAPIPMENNNTQMEMEDW